ncbi:HAMP domain-containing histidine kinase, partial [Candidatus Saccharibacteria bacterium]|nr:HAMP domain-containing histidine kinase [Candidatus Saccharibacteria bacterium]
LLESTDGMKNNLFHNASLRLTSLYLVIIMFLSLLFSFRFYQVSIQEIDRNTERPLRMGQILRLQDDDFLQEYLDQQDMNAVLAKQRLKANLISLNLLILVTGGLLSYYLARRSLQPIEEAHEAQSRFISDASHELRTPITAMRAETELTLTEPKLTLAQAKKQLESNMEELDKLTQLSEGILNLSRLENNSVDLSKVSLREVVQTAIERVLPHAEAKKQLIVVDNLDQTEIQAQKTSLTEALVTILENAVKYSPEKTEIRVNSTVSDDSINLTIADQGVGMTKDEQKRIFDRFYRADQSRTKNKVNGFGIGLSIAKATIEAHNGTISVTSTPKKGSTFTIQLPLR